MARLIIASLVFVCAAMASASAVAQDWPSRPIRWVNPYAAGGASDILTRLVGGQKLAERIGQPVITETRTGAGGTIGTDFVAKSQPDGYTMLVCNIGPMAINPSLFKNLPYDPQKDLVPITLLMAYGVVIVVHPSVPVYSLKELIALAKSKPMPFAGNAVGTSSHLAGELLARAAQIKLLHIPFRGGPDGLLATMTGTVPMAVGDIAPTLPFIRSGKLRALVVTSRERSPLMPDIPTVIEAGLPGFEVTGWVGVCLPKNTPASIVTRLAQEFSTIMGMPDVRKAVTEMGAYVPTLGPGFFGEFIRSEITKWRQVIEAANIKVE
ncbi:MAG: tripartite tricarboxylate transporter substrate binding protein [Betaproteobacteria bacterium]|nr:tripartite tricarboxylate transporter substrate binding protein [Betaproteobacteria bacterium]